VIGALIRSGENALESSRSAGRGQSDYSLMIFRIGETIELATLFKTDGNVSRAGELDNFLDAGVLAAARDQDAVEGAAGVESFAYGVNAGKFVHRSHSLQHVGHDESCLYNRNAGAN
jgi:hypothetical protein